MAIHFTGRKGCHFLLTGCGKTKSDTAAPAAELYTGKLCQLRRQYAEAHLHAVDCHLADNAEWIRRGQPGMQDAAYASYTWHILSAEHGLLDPDQVIEPYEKDLAKCPKAERVAWAERVAEEIVQQIERAGQKRHESKVEIHAGAAYAEELTRQLMLRKVRVYWRTEGLQIGQQLQAYPDWIERKANPLRIDWEAVDRYDAEEAAEAALPPFKGYPGCAQERNAGKSYEQARAAKTLPSSGLPSQGCLFDWAEELAA